MKRKLLIVIALFLFLFGALAAGVYFFWGMEQQKAVLEKTMSAYLHRSVIIERAHLQLIPWTRLVLEGVTIEERERYGSFVSLRKLCLGLSLRHLLVGTFLFTYLTVDHPSFALVREGPGRWNCTDLVHALLKAPEPWEEPSPIAKKLTFVLERVAVRQGTVEFRDLSLSRAQVIAVEKLELATGINPAHAETTFSFHCQVRGDENATRLQGKGALSLVPTQSLAQALKFRANLALTALDMDVVAPYLPKALPLVPGQGKLSGTCSLEGIWGGKIQSAATIELMDCALKGYDEETKEVQISKATLKLNASKDGDTLLAHRVELSLPEGKVVAKASLVTGAKPSFQASGTAENLSYRKCAAYLHHAFPDPSARDFVLNRIREGNIEKLSFRYSGFSPGSAQAPEDKGTSDLELVVTFSDCAVQVAEHLPLCRQLRGNLHYWNGEVELTGLTGFLGNSQIESGAISLSRSRFLDISARVALDLEEVGRILHSPLLPAEAQVHLKSLLGLGGSGLLTLDLSGPLTDLGSVTFGGSLELRDATVDYPRFFHVASRVNGIVAFTPYVIEFKNITGLWETSPFTCSGTIESYRNRQSKLNIHVESAQADINDIISAFFPWKDTYGQGEGRTAMDFYCEGYQSGRFRFKGRAWFQGISLTFSAFPSPFTDITGEVEYASEGLTFHDVRFKSGSSDVSFSARVAGYQKPRITGHGTGSFIDLADFYTFSPAEGEGTPEHYEIEGVSLTADKGRYQDLVVAKVKTTGSYRNGTLVLSDLKVEEGSYGPFVFSNLRTSTEQDAPAPVTYQKGVATTTLLVFDAYGGTWTCRDVSLPLNPKEAADFSLGAQLKDVSVDKLLEGLPPEKQKLTGIMTLEATLSGMGKNPTEGLKSSHGAATLIIKHGVLQKAQILSKLFSLLNVSRIFSQDYGKLLNSGMAYDTIQGDFAIDQGNAKINLLSFDSPAMKMNGVGDINVGNKTLDMEIAVQPLETVDKVIGNIPILGTVLKGDQGAVVVTYYTLTGSFSDPKLKQVVFQSLGRKGQGIFRRIFKLPGDLLRTNGHKKPEATPLKEGTEAAAS